MKSDRMYKIIDNLISLNLLLYRQKAIFAVLMYRDIVLNGQIAITMNNNEKIGC